MKYKPLISLFVIACIIIAGCNTNNPSSSSASPTMINSQKSEETVIVETVQKEDGWNLNTLLQNTNVVFSGTCRNKKDIEERGTDIQMMVDTVYRGDISSDVLVDLRTHEGELFQEGLKYLIFGTPYASVYEQRELYYYTDTVVYQTGNNTYTDGISKLAGLSYDSIISQVQTAEKEYPYIGDGKTVGEYCSSPDIADSVEFADCIVRVIPTTSNVPVRTNPEI